MCQEPSPACFLLQREIITPDYFWDGNIEPGFCIQAAAAPAHSKARLRVPSFHHSCITRPSVSLGVLSNCLGCILSLFFFVVYFSFQSVQPSSALRHDCFYPSRLFIQAPLLCHLSVSDLSTSRSLCAPLQSQFCPFVHFCPFISKSGGRLG